MRASWRTGRVKAMRVAGFAGLLDRGGLQRAWTLRVLKVERLVRVERRTGIRTSLKSKS